MNFDPSDTAVVVIDPQNDVLSPSGRNWEVLEASVTENNTVGNLVEIFTAAKAGGFALFVSPHYFYPLDHGWLFNGPLESDELRTDTFARRGPLTLDGFTGSGADWLEEFKSFIDDGSTIVASPHKCGDLKPTTWSCNCASAGSPKSSCAACSPTSVWSRTCGISSSRASRWRWCATPPPALDIRAAVTAIRRHW